MEDCLFCKIIKNQIPSYKIYENEYAYAFLDISEDIDGHTLVIPKKHCKNILDCDSQTLSEVMKVVKKIAEHYTTNCGFDGVNIISNNEQCAEQSIFHFHVHILPRKNDDGEKVYPKLGGAKQTLKQMHQMLKMN
ncbi:MAG: HIT family protein [Clostridia bacterium]|nr:HIT family protein [Clostridia bacterium]